MIISKKQRSFNIILNFFLLTFLIFSISAGNKVKANELTAETDRKNLSAGETLTLTLEYSGTQPHKAPKANVLENNFKIIRNYQKSQTSFINGTVSSSLSWVYELLPKKTGKIQIPSIKLGTLSTNPININVKKIANSKEQVPVNQDIFVKAEVNNKTPFVQEQVLYTLKIYDKIGIQSGSIENPKTNDIIIKPNPRTKEYKTKIKDNIYKVIEQTFAVFPQKSGLISIPPVKITARIPRNKIKNRQKNDIFDSPFFEDFLQLNHSKDIYSNTIDLNVNPIPKNYNGNKWLPAKNIKLTDQFSTSEINNNEPIERNITITAKGLTETQLPEINIPEVKGLKQYKEIINEKTYFDENNNVISEKTANILIMPESENNKDSKITLPQISVKWFNTDTNLKDITLIPEKTISLKTSGKTQKITVEEKSVKQPINQETEKQTKISKKTILILLITFLVLSVLALMPFVYKKIKNYHNNKEKDPKNKSKTKKVKDAVEKHNDTKKKPMPKTTKKELISALVENNPKKSKELLIKYFNELNPTTDIKTLEQVAKSSKKELKTEIEKLIKAAYKKDEKWNGKKLKEEIEKLKIKTKENNIEKDLIPKLYPN